MAIYEGFFNHHPPLVKSLLLDDLLMALGSVSPITQLVYHTITQHMHLTVSL